MLIRPVGEKERVISIDVMRGFALLGIFVVNMLFFHSPYIYINPYTWYQIPGDYETHKWIDIFVQGSVYPLFSMLFGYGLAMQFMKSQERGTSFSKLAVRRLSVLLIDWLYSCISYMVRGYIDHVCDCGICFIINDSIKADLVSINKCAIIFTS